MRYMTRKCGDHFHAALFDENGQIVIEEIGDTAQAALDNLDLAILADMLANIVVIEDLMALDAAKTSTLN